MIRQNKHDGLSEFIECPPTANTKELEIESVNHSPESN